MAACKKTVKDQIIQNHNIEEVVDHEVSTLSKKLLATDDLLRKGESVFFEDVAPGMLCMTQ